MSTLLECATAYKSTHSSRSTPSAGAVSDVMSSPELPGIGVFGTGTAVRCLVPILKYHGFSVEALWGRTKDAVDECGKDLNIAFKTSKVDEVLLHKDVDLVFIYCPPHLQSPIAAKALGIGKHVICGTPAGPSQLDALKMVHAAEYYPKLMSLMGNGLRFLPCFQKMKEYIDDDYIGNITVIEARVHSSCHRDKYDWTCDELMGGGALNTFGSVIIDLITYLTKQKASRVHGMLRTFTKNTDKIKGIRQITSDDFCTIQMEMDGGACATITINCHMQSQYTQELLICGSKGRLVVRDMDLYGTKHDNQLKEEVLHRESDERLKQEQLGIAESNHGDIPLPHLKGLVTLISSVREAFMDDTDDRHTWSEGPVSEASTFEDGQYIQTVVDMLRKSSKSRDWIKVSILKEEPDPNPYLSDAMRRSTLSLYV